MLKIVNLKVSIPEKNILNGVNLNVEDGKTVVLMGQNGSGKSTLAQTIMGHPSYEIKEGTVEFNGVELNELEPDEKSKAGIFLSFQYPSEIPGVTISSYLRLIYNKSHGTKLSPAQFRKILTEKMAFIEMKEDFASRYLNEGFSGGEKKRMEMLQLLLIEPKLAILDEVDSGLDVDALKVISKVINHLKETTKLSVLIITHYTRILKHIDADEVHIMQEGQIIKSGDKSLAHELEEKGYIF